MNLPLPLSPEIEQELTAQAAAQKCDLESFLIKQIQSQVITPMVESVIHDRGRGPEIRGTRITVYDVLDYIKHGQTASEIAAIFRVVTPFQVEAALKYLREHHDEVMVEYQKMLNRDRQGDPPEIRAKAAASQAKRIALVEERRKAANGEK